MAAITLSNSSSIIACVHCGTSLQRNQEITCLACDSVSYCNESCKAMHKDEHQFQCEIFRSEKIIASLLRIEAMIRQHLARDSVERKSL